MSFAVPFFSLGIREKFHSESRVEDEWAIHIRDFPSSPTKDKKYVGGIDLGNPMEALVQDRVLNPPH